MSNALISKYMRVNEFRETVYSGVFLINLQWTDDASVEMIQSIVSYIRNDTAVAYGGGRRHIFSLVRDIPSGIRSNVRFVQINIAARGGVGGLSTRQMALGLFNSAVPLDQFDSTVPLDIQKELCELVKSFAVQ